MATMKFNAVRMEQFKCNRDATYNLFNRTDVIGKNGSGKSTLGLSLVLPFTGKDLNGRANPELHPDFMQESEPHITINGSIDDKPVTVEMIQKDLRTKKQVEENAPAKIGNKYKLNSVDKSATAFKAALAERGIDLDAYEKLTSTSYFSSLKEADKRSLIFGMADSSITDQVVAEALGEEASSVCEMLDNYSLTEIEAKAKSDKKAAESAKERIPDQIVGAEASKQEVNVKELSAKKEEISNKIADYQTEFDNIKNISRASIRQMIEDKKLSLKIATDKANDVRNSKIRTAKSELMKSADELDALQNKISHQESQIQRLTNAVNDRTEKMNRQLAEYNALKAESFPEDKSICPTCGQKLPQDKVAENKTVWEKNKSQKLEAMKNSGNALALEIKNFQKELEQAKVELQMDQDCLKKQKEIYAVAEDALKKLQAEPSVEPHDLPEYQQTFVEISNLENQLGDIDKIEEERARKLTEINALRLELIDVEKELAKDDFNKRIDEKIESLRQEQREAAQNKADADRILNMVAMVNQKKNEMLSESVNSNFPEWMRFKLFMTQKNGEIKDCCIPEIRNESGEWKDYLATANNALKLRADVAILEALQTHFGIRVPIIIDNAECLDTHSKSLIKSESQLIFLTVKDDTELTVTELS